MENKMIYRIIPFGRLKISSKPLLTMLSYQQHRNNIPESGGLVAGRYLLESEDIVVDVVTVPTEGDIQGRYFFKKNFNNHQNLLKIHWGKSKGTCNYIGEWHTHPESVPTPSNHDYKQWQKVLMETKSEQELIFFIIVGTKQIRVWQGFRKSGKVMEIFSE